MPEELLPTIPPNKQNWDVEVLGPKKSPFSLRNRFNVSRFTPGWTLTVFFSTSKSKIFVKCFEISTIIPSPTHCPARDVPAALGISPNLLVLAKPTIFCISEIVFGNAIAKGSLL